MYRQICRHTNILIKKSRRFHVTSKLAGAAGDARSSWKVTKDLLYSDERHTESDAAVNQNICDGFCKFFFDKLATMLAKFWSSSHPENSYLLHTSPRLHVSTSPGLTTFATTIWYVSSTTYRPNRPHSTSSPTAFSRAAPMYSAADRQTSKLVAV